MTDPSAAAPPDHDAQQLPKRTTPTWEMELLISGALVFSLLQLPALLDSWLLRWLPLATEDFRGPLAAITAYLRTALLTLSVAFVLHLMLRAYWVALVGVHSVHPGGTRWEKIVRGPILRQVSAAQAQPLPTRIETIDNLASVVFALGVAMGLMMLALTLSVGGVMLLSGVAGHFRLLGQDGPFWMLVLLALVMGPRALAAVLDRLLGARLAPAHWLHRLIRWILARPWWLPGMQAANDVLQPILSNARGRGSGTLYGLGIFVVLMVSAFSMPMIAERLRLRVLAPDRASAQLLLPVHYRDERRGYDQLSPAPSIASRELGERALQLFVPLRAGRHPPALRQACPELAAGPPRTDRKDPVSSLKARGDWDALQLRCAHRVFAPQLDGQPWPDDAGLPVFADDPRSGFEGLWWRLDNGRVTPGRHALRVNDPMVPEAGEPTRPPTVIVFWR